MLCADVSLGRIPCGCMALQDSKQVLRLRSWFASRTSYCAQDDNFF
jgi:hypothetical protein